MQYSSWILVIENFTLSELFFLNTINLIGHFKTMKSPSFRGQLRGDAAESL